jgi:hypothetical protein
MTDILIRNFSIARKPRSIKQCAQCAEPCYPGLPRYRAQYREGHEDKDGFFHLFCVTKWLTQYVRDHRDLLKKEGIK